MRVGLFVPCYVDAFHPDVGIATLELLERFGIDVEYPFDQTCCGRPMTNSGCHAESAATEALFLKKFAKFDYIVGPSGSCTHHVRNNLHAIEQTEAVRKVRASTYELVEFLHDVLKVDAFPWAESRTESSITTTVMRYAGSGMQACWGYLPQHLIVLVDPADIVLNLHHAYQRPEFRQGHYAVFHTGPSATADIEGVLIHGAQGVRSLTVLPLARGI